MELRQGYQLAPGQCFTCGNSDQKAFVIDLNRDDPGVVRRSHVYVCSSCVAAMARLLDPYVDWALVLKGTLDLLTDSANELGEVRERAERAEATLRSLAEMLPAAAPVPS